MYKILSAIVISIIIILSFYFYPRKFTQKEIRLGMSAPFSGNKKNLGVEVLMGANAYLKSVNKTGGIYGRLIRIIFKDDRYESKLAAQNAQKLIQDDKIFAFFGVVGTPTSKAILPIALENDIPYLGAFSGANFLRKPINPLIVNVRASYEDETEKLISFFVDYKKFTRIAVFYQNDDYGRSGLRGVRKALDKRNLKIIGEGSYKRNTLSVGNALYEISLTRPEAIILVGTTIPVAQFIKRARSNKKIISNVNFGILSFVSPKLLVKTLNYKTENIVFSQVVPSPWTSKEKEVIDYRELMTKYFPKKDFGYVSLEGYFAARLTVEALKAVGANFTKEDFIKEMKKLSNRGTYLHRVNISEYKNGKFTIIKEDVNEK